MKLGLFFTIALLSLSTYVRAAPPSRVPLIIRHPAPESEHDQRWLYDKAVLDLCLSKTVEEYGPYQLITAPPMNQKRALANLQENRLLDVVAVTSTSKRERELLVVPYSIHRDLMGIKLLLIRKESQQQFAKIKSLPELRKLVGGQQMDWADSEILRSNGLKIRTGTSYEGLFKMLENGRFDYFPRSLPEIFEEVKARGLIDIIVEPTLALVYSMPAYMFVNKKNKGLAERLSLGMQIAQADGSFDKLFLSKHGESIKKAQLQTRRIFYLNNPIRSQFAPNKPELEMNLKNF